MSEIEIDESKHKPERTFLQKLRDLFIGMVFGALIVQVLLFWVSSRSIVLLFDRPLFLIFLAVCGIFGWMYGNNFTDWLRAKIIASWF